MSGHEAELGDGAGSFLMMWRLHCADFLNFIGYTAGGSLIFYWFTTYLHKFLVNTTAAGSQLQSSAIVLAEARSTNAPHPPSCVTKYTAATTTRPRPAATRTAALTPLDWRILYLAALLLPVAAWAQATTNVVIATELGDIVVALIYVDGSGEVRWARRISG